MTTQTPTLPIHNPRALAAQLKDLNLPGQRSMTAITRLRRQRANNTPTPQSTPLQERLNTHLVDRYSTEIWRRGGETELRVGRDKHEPLTVTDRDQNLTLLHVEGWRHYTSSTSWRAALSYLCGQDDAGPWSVRVPGTITTITAALRWVIPADVRDAQARGARVDRQGDIYAIATTKNHDAPTGWVGDTRSHHWDQDTRVLSHHPADGRRHADLVLPHPVRFAQQRAYGHGRGAGLSAAD